MRKQDQNQSGKRHQTCAKDQMLRKTVLPVIAIALCGLLLLAVSAWSGTTQTQATATQPASFTDKQWLGKQLFFDPNLSQPPGQACMDCHDPAAGWADPNKNSPTSAGNIPGLFGKRNSPSAAYASFSPDFHYDVAAMIYVGGQTWDGSTENLKVHAKVPILNPLEMAAANKLSVIDVVKAGPYADLFKKVWGANVFEDTETAFEDLSASIAEYEMSSEVNSFSSKYDDVLRGTATLTDQEKRGLDLFNGKANCNKCHTSAADPASGKVLFTNFTYENLGVPKNPENKFYTLHAQYNPAGINFVDFGLGGFLEKPSENGKFSVPSLRNIALTAPYMHNGYFTTLQDVVRFDNTRDVASAGWPAPEVAENVNKQDVGNLKLTDSEIEDIVAFLNTLTDTKFPTAPTTATATSTPTTSTSTPTPTVPPTATVASASPSVAPRPPSTGSGLSSSSSGGSVWLWSAVALVVGMVALGAGLGTYGYREGRRGR